MSRSPFFRAINLDYPLSGHLAICPVECPDSFEDAPTRFDRIPEDKVSTSSIIQAFDSDAENWNYHDWIGVAGSLYTLAEEEFGEGAGRRLLLALARQHPSITGLGR